MNYKDKLAKYLSMTIDAFIVCCIAFTITVILFKTTNIIPEPVTKFICVDCEIAHEFS